MGLFYCCCCTILVIVNVIFMLLGLAFLALGIIFNLGKNFIISFIQFIVNTMKIVDSKSAMQAEHIKTILEYASPIYIALIVIGSVIFILSIIGMCSVCCKSKVLIIIFISILSVMIAAQVVVVILCAVDPEKVKDGLNAILKAMIGKYDGFDSKTPESSLINLLNMMMNCCGSKGYGDFYESTKFIRNPVTYTGNNGNTKTYNITLLFPISCCPTMNMQFTDVDGCITGKSPNNKDVGCTEKLFASMQKDLTLVYQIAWGIIGFQGLILIAAIICLVSIYQDQPGIKPV